MKLVYPQVRMGSQKRVFISFYLNNARHRLYTGKRIGSSINPNSYPISERLNIGNLLAAELYRFLSNGGTLITGTNENILDTHSDFFYLEKALKKKLKGNSSQKYKDMLSFVYYSFTKEFNVDNITNEVVDKFMDNYSNGSSYNTIRRHLNVLFNEAVQLGMEHNPMSAIKSRKAKAVLHKPFKNVKQVLEDVLSFNEKLHLCCLLTYGCLLRPHREIRELRWNDFTDDLCYIKLSGKNRIVPVPDFVKQYLIKLKPHHNIFTCQEKPHNPDYFKTLWSRYKKQSEVLEDEHTLYSFRHSGAINIYTRTGSLTKLWDIHH